jgi:imidazolonepropionase-like amidohydrolase
MKIQFKGKKPTTSYDKAEPERKDVKGKTKIIRGGLLIDGKGGKPVKGPVIVLEGNTIKDVGAGATSAVPPDVEVIDCSQYTLMPGLMDLHIHTAMFNCLTFHNYRVAQWEIAPELQQMYVLFHAQCCFDMGFTTLRDLGMVSSRGLLTAELCAVRDAINAGIFVGPRMVIGGWTSITGSHLDLVNPRAMVRTGFQTADGPWELRKLARTNLRWGCDVIKTCASGGGGTDKEEPDIRNMTQEEIDAIVDEAHAFHKQAAVHCFTPEAHKMAVKAGTDTIEHMVFHSDESIELIAKAGISVTPTLLHRTDFAIDLRREMGTARFVLEKMKYIQPFCYDTFQKMHKAGINIAMGTDMGQEPESGSNAKELQLYVDLGMTPMEAIQTATRNAAIALNRSDLGTIESGKLADIIAVDGDPSVDVGVLAERGNIKMVMKEGEVHVDRRPGKNRSAVQVEHKSWKILDYV